LSPDDTTMNAPATLPSSSTLTHATIPLATAGVEKIAAIPAAAVPSNTIDAVRITGANQMALVVKK